MPRPQGLHNHSPKPLAKPSQQAFHTFNCSCLDHKISDTVTQRRQTIMILSSFSVHQTTDWESSWEQRRLGSFNLISIEFLSHLLHLAGVPLSLVVLLNSSFVSFSLKMYVLLIGWHSIWRWIIINYHATWISPVMHEATQYISSSIAFCADTIL